MVFPFQIQEILSQVQGVVRDGRLLLTNLKMPLILVNQKNWFLIIQDTETFFAHRETTMSKNNLPSQ